MVELRHHGRWLLLLLAPLASGSSFDVEVEAADYADELDARNAAKEAQSNESFETIMQGNVVLMPAPAAEATKNVQGGDDYFDTPDEAERLPVGGKAEIPLAEFDRTDRKLREVREEAARQLGPPVVLGSAYYEGRATEGSLELTLQLTVTLGIPGQWKTVPLVGDSVVVMRASRSGWAIPLSRQNGYHVWHTNETGLATIELQLLVPASGPRGSIEYDFSVARTPVTHFACTFPVPGLEPRLHAAVQSESTTLGSTTRVEATLRPTTRINVVGFRDLGDAEERKAKVYSESLNLLSLGESGLDVFSVIRYNILYAGTKDFLLRIPKGMTVVSADGKGAFRYVIEENAEGTLLRGETAFPIRNTYEISVRLHREIDRNGEGFGLVRPTPVGVERAHGWLAVEVTGKLKLEAKEVEEATPVDIRQLPPEMINSAVSPILAAFRYHNPKASVQMVATRLPEKEPASASVDSVKAFSVVSPTGAVLTEMRIRLRNRLRPHLNLTLPEGFAVRSTLLDGNPIKPSQGDDATLRLPLKRSAGSGRLEPFELQVVLENDIGALGWLGSKGLALPALDLPVSSFVWNLYLPAHNSYHDVEGDIREQLYTGTGHWQQPVLQDLSEGNLANAPLAFGPAPGQTSSADSGAMPVRIRLPKTGQRVRHSRYWLPQAQPAELSFYYVRSWLHIPFWLLMALLCGAGAVLVIDRWLPASRLRRLHWGWGLAAIVVFAWPMMVAGGAAALFVACVAAGGVLLFWHGADLLARGKQWGLDAIAGLRAQPEPIAAEGKGKEPKISASLVLWRIFLLGSAFVIAILLLVAGVQFLAMLFSPMAG